MAYDIAYVQRMRDAVETRSNLMKPIGNSFEAVVGRTEGIYAADISLEDVSPRLTLNASSKISLAQG